MMKKTMSRALAILLSTVTVMLSPVSAMAETVDCRDITIVEVQDLDAEEADTKEAEAAEAGAEDIAEEDPEAAEIKTEDTVEEDPETDDTVEDIEAAEIEADDTAEDISVEGIDVDGSDADQDYDVMSPEELAATDWEEFIKRFPNELPERYVYTPDTDELTDRQDDILADASDDLCAEGYVSTGAVLPVAYDARSNGTVTSVKDQGQYGLCWDFAVAACAESCLIVNGYANRSVDLSEAQIAYAYWKHYKYNVFSTYSDFINSYYTNHGGNFNKARQLYSSGYGTALEYQAPYTNVKGMTEGCLNYKNYDYVKSYGLLLDNDAEKMQGAKELIKKYGGLYTSVVAYQSDDVNFGFSRPASSASDYTLYFNIPVSNSNAGAYPWHAVEIVGWDDNYSKNNFKIAPPGNGAWLCKNSWGTGGYYSGSGYFWLSYYDQGHAYSYSYAIEVAPRNSYYSQLDASASEIRLYQGTKKQFTLTWGPDSSAKGYLKAQLRNTDSAWKLTRVGQSGNTATYEIEVGKDAKRTSNTVICSLCHEENTSSYAMEANTIKEIQIPVYAKEATIDMTNITGNSRTFSSSGNLEVDGYEETMSSYRLPNCGDYLINASITYDPAYSDASCGLRFASSDPAVASVDADGRIKTNQYGTCVITMENTDANLPVRKSIAISVISEGITLKTDGLCYESCAVVDSVSCPVVIETKEGLDVTDQVTVDRCYQNIFSIQDGVLTYSQRGYSYTGSCKINYSDGTQTHYLYIPVKISIKNHEPIDLAQCEVQKKGQLQDDGNYSEGQLRLKCRNCNAIYEEESISYPIANINGSMVELSMWSVHFGNISLVSDQDYTVIRESGQVYALFTPACRYYQGKMYVGYDYSYVPEDTEEPDYVYQDYGDQNYDDSNYEYQSYDYVNYDDAGYDYVNYDNQSYDYVNYDNQSYMHQNHNRKNVTKPAKASVKKIKKIGSQKIKVTAGKVKNAYGYEYRIATDKNFKKHVKKYFSRGRTYTFKKLKKNTTYYVRIRAYKMHEGKKIYGKWSSPKKIKSF